MKVSRERMREHRDRILAAAARLFRERGFEDVTVAQVMKAAGLTHGGFYGHFASKAELINQALAHLRDIGGAQSPASHVDAYLSKQHRDNRGSGCPVAALGSEAARAPAEVRAALSRTIQAEIDRLAAAFPGTPAQRRRAAIATYSTMVGALVLARIVHEEAFSEEILSAARGAIDLH